ncbi:MAG: ABC transporter ATP-binding protein [Oscillospiraceae bacterium]|nr:ABC transporter ATP-binding protein [Oscillospiraceae bacterium]
MLYIQNLEKSYGVFPVLRGLNMRVRKGDVYGFLGTNGCGKTTTMNIICNILKKDTGEITFGKEDIKIGYLPEAPALYGYMNGFEYLDFIAACCEYEGDIKKRTAEVLQITGMYDSASRQIKTYSRGMNQRVGIAAAIYSDPDLLILDEPTSALDPEGRAEVMEIISKLAKAGSTIILCTHILTDVERVANKIGIISKGVMAYEGALDDMKRAFGVDNAVTVRPGFGSDIGAALQGVDIIESQLVEFDGDITFYAKEGVAEAELFYKIVTTLAAKQIVPEGVWFRRLSLEQIYLGITNGSMAPDYSERGR